MLTSSPSHLQTASEMRFRFPHSFQALMKLISEARKIGFSARGRTTNPEHCEARPTEKEIIIMGVRLHLSSLRHVGQHAPCRAGKDYESRPSISSLLVSGKCSGYLGQQMTKQTIRNGASDVVQAAAKPSTTPRRVASLTFYCHDTFLYR